MINFHVPNWIFKLIQEGNKHHEYREYKHYWIKKFANVNPPLMANFYRGYSNDKIEVTITKISLIPKNKIPIQSYRDFITTEECYDIMFKVDMS